MNKCKLKSVLPVVCLALMLGCAFPSGSLEESLKENEVSCGLMDRSDPVFGETKSISKSERIPADWLIIGVSMSTYTIQYIGNPAYGAEASYPVRYESKPSNWIITGETGISGTNFHRRYIKYIGNATYGDSVLMLAQYNAVPSNWFVIGTSGTIPFSNGSPYQLRIFYRGSASYGDQVWILSKYNAVPTNWVVVSVQGIIPYTNNSPYQKNVKYLGDAPSGEEVWILSKYSRVPSGWDVIATSGTAGSNNYLKLIKRQ